jgi:chemotaxis protein histidine kinase CheA
MKKWQSYTALKQVKQETESLTAALANALETVIVTPTGEAKALNSLQAPVAAFSIIPGIMALLEFPNIGLLGTEILKLLEDTLAHPDMDAGKCDARLQNAYIAVTELPAVLDEALAKSVDSFARVFNTINRLRKACDKAAVFHPRVLSTRQKMPFKQQFAATPDKMKDVMARHSSLFIKAGKALLEDRGNARAVTALKGAAGNMEILFRDYRLGTLWGLAAGVIETLQSDSSEGAVKSIIALGKPLHLLSTGDLSQLDMLDEDAASNMLAIIAETRIRSLRLAVIRQWFGLDRKASRQMKRSTRNLMVRYERKSALNKSLRVINEDINRLIDTINQMIESGPVTQEKVDDVYADASSLREVLHFLNFGSLAQRFDDSLKDGPAEPLDKALTHAAGVLFEISKEVFDTLERLDRGVFSAGDGLPNTNTLWAARQHVYLNAMKLLEAVVTDIDAYVENGCQGSDLDKARDRLDELSQAFIMVSLPELQQYLATARHYVNLVVRDVAEAMPDATFNALSHLVINSLWHLEQLSIGREEDSQAYQKKIGRFAAILQAFIDSHSDPDPGAGSAAGTETAVDDRAGQNTESAASTDESDQPAALNAAGLAASMLVEQSASAYEPREKPELGKQSQEELQEKQHDVPEEEPVPIDEPKALRGETREPVEEPEPEPEPVEALGDTPPEVQPPACAQSSADDVAADDDELDALKEIFAEEFDEVLENLQEELGSLKDDYQQPSALKDCCRYFHALKGSGGVVGAEIIATLSFAMECLYDTLQEQGSTNDAVMDLTVRVIAILPAMKANFMNPAESGPEPTLIQSLCQEAVSHLSAQAAANIAIPVLADVPAGKVEQEADAAADSAVESEQDSLHASVEDTNDDIPVITDNVLAFSDSVDLSDDTLVAQADSTEVPAAEATEASIQQDSGDSDEAKSVDTVKPGDDDDFDDGFAIKEAHEEATRGLVINAEKASAMAAAGDAAAEEEEIDCDFEIDKTPVAALTPTETVALNLVGREIQELNDTLSAILGGAEDSPKTSDLQIPLHTLYGIARAQNFEQYADAVKAMKHFIERHPHKGINADMALVFQGFCLLTDKQGRHLDKGGSGEYAGLAFAVIDLEKALLDLAETLDAQQASAETDTGSSLNPQMVGFLREARDLIAKLGLSQSPQDMAKVLSLLAGAAEVAELDAIEKVAASLEAACQQNSENTALAALISEGRQWLDAAPALLEAGTVPEDTSRLCERLLAALSGDATPPAAVEESSAYQAPVSASMEALAEAKPAGESHEPESYASEPEPEPEPGKIS